MTKISVLTISVMMVALNAFSAISDFVVYDYVRSEQQMIDNLSNPPSGTKVLFWDFSEQFDQGNDISGNNRDGNSYGVTCGVPMTGPYGTTKMCASGFNTKECYIAGNTGLNVSHAQTYEFWVRNPQLSGDAVIFSISGTEAGGADYDRKRLWINSDGSLTFADRGYYTGIQTSTTSSLTWITNTWYRIYITISASSGNYHTVNIYRGVAGDSSVSTLITVNSSTPVFTNLSNWAAIGGHLAGYYTGNVGKEGYLGCDAVSSVIVNIDSLGAVGDGVTDDTDALYNAARLVSAYGAGTLEFTTGKTYQVGRETVNTSSTAPYYNYAPLGKIMGVTGNVVINGNDATIKLAPNLHFGAFNPETGVALANPETTTDPLWAAKPGDLLNVKDCTNVEIKNLNCDGNNQNTIWGGLWTGDFGIQIQTSCLNVINNKKVNIHDCSFKYGNLDGIFVFNDVNDDSPKYEVYIDNVVSSYNARCGLSYNSGNHLIVSNTEFSHTGMVPNRNSAVHSGVDIEPMAYYYSPPCVFDNCIFFNNYYAGLMTYGNKVYDVVVKNCLLWATENNSFSYFANYTSYGLFSNCDFYGCVYMAGDSKNIRFTGCSIQNPDSSYYSDSFPAVGTSSRVLVEGNGYCIQNSSIEASHNYSFYSFGASTSAITNSTITHNNPTNSVMANSVAQIGKTYLEKVIFNETDCYNGWTGPSFPYVRVYNSWIGQNVTIEGQYPDADHILGWYDWYSARPLAAQTITPTINDVVLTPNAGSGEIQGGDSNCSYTVSFPFNNPGDSTGTRLFNKDLPYDDWNACVGATCWSGQDNVQILTVDLVNTYNVRKIAFKMKRELNRLEKIVISIGDGSSWTQAGILHPQDEVAGPNTYGGDTWVEILAPDTISGRYVKAEMTYPFNKATYIDELKIYGYSTP